MSGTIDPPDDDGGFTPELLATLDPDPVAAEALVRKLIADVSRWLEWQQQCRDPEGAAAEAVFRALQKVHAGTADVSRSGFRAFTFGVARNVAMEMRRAEQKGQQLEPRAWAAQQSRTRQAQQIEAGIMLEDLQRLLSPGEWEILCRYCTEKDHDAQARAMGVSTGYLRVIVHRIREELKAKMLAGA